MKYYAKLINNEIQYLGMGKKVPKNCTEVTKEQYNNLIIIIDSVPEREGYIAILHLHLDGTYTVDYEAIIYEEEGVL